MANALSPAEQLAELPRVEREIFLMGLTREELHAMRWDWRFWARPAQLEPPGDWTTWVAMAGRGFGKALALDTPLASPHGWVTMGTVQAGDHLFDEQGQVCTVLAAHPVLEDRTCYRVVFSDGSVIVADGDHLWSTLSKRRRKSMRRNTDIGLEPPVTTLDLRNSLSERGDVEHCIPCCEALDLPDQELLIDPYLLGLWLGDGHSKSASITTMDPEVVQAFADAGYTIRALGSDRSGKADSYRISETRDKRKRDLLGRYGPAQDGFYYELKLLNLLRNKHVPKPYLRGSYSQRLALLQGLMDSDGTCNKISGRCSFSSTLPHLTDAVEELAVSLGLKTSRYDRVGRCVRRGVVSLGKHSYRVGFTAYIHTPVFRLARKLRYQRVPKTQVERQTRRYVVAVEPADSVPVRCITVDSPSALYLAGRTMIPTHNTRLGAEWVRDNVCGPTPMAPGRARRVALVAETAADGRDVMVAGPSGILAVHPPDQRPRYVKSERALHWPNGAIALVFSAEDPEQLRGPEHDLAWSDEAAKWKYPQETWDMLQFGLRLGERPRQLVTTTPKPIPLVRGLLEREGRDVKVTRGSTYDNASNLAAGFIRQMRERYEGTRLGKQELHAIVLDDVPGALWTRNMFQVRKPNVPGLELAAGMGSGDTLPDLARVVVGVDPSGTSGEEDDASDSVGIVVVALGVDGAYYVLEDATCNLGPAGWARRTVEKYRLHQADLVVGERNFGGSMVEYTIRTVDRQINYKDVVASRGKVLRAEPVAALYERGQVRHVGNLAELEDQMCNLSRTGYLGRGSPDRLDALVWAITELMDGKSDYDPRIYDALAGL